MQNFVNRDALLCLATPLPASEGQFVAEPDRVICGACAEEILTPGRPRFRYPFASCSHCGPRFSVLKRLPHEHANTALAPFDRCIACDGDYYDPTDRHFRAEATFCRHCGPRASLIRFDGGPIPLHQHSALDDVDAACSLIQRGEIVAIKGLGGWQLACDATNEAAVMRLRQAKQSAKPFALMARDLHVIARYCAIGLEEELQLTSAQGPIVILRRSGESLPENVAPGLSTLGFMLPTTALHLLLMQRMNRPVVMTSGNLSGEPQIIDDAEAQQTLSVAIRYALTHNYRIANRVEDSVVRVVGGRPRLIRRARGYAPTALPLPRGFERACDLVAIGSDHKGVFCLVKQGEAIPAPQYGDIADLEACRTYQGTICQFRNRMRHKVSVLAIDSSDDYLSSNMSRTYTAEWKLGLIEVDHHHAHIASCLAENGYPLDAPPVLGIALDGLAWDDSAERPASEFLLADYRRYEALASLKPFIVSGKSMRREPWRDLYDQVTAAMGQWAFSAHFGTLQSKACLAVDAMAANGRARRVSSCGALFDAVAAALGLARDRQAYDGEAAMRLEAAVDARALGDEVPTIQYPVALEHGSAGHLPSIDPSAMWPALLADLARETPVSEVAARFHFWLASSLAAMAAKLARRWEAETPLTTVALSGGCFQNRILLERTEYLLRCKGFTVLSHISVPPHNGGLSLGQAAIASARRLDETASRARNGISPV